MAPSSVLVASGAALAALATVLVRWSARRVGAVKPTHVFVPAHTRPVPCLGGLAIAAASGAVVALEPLALPRWMSVGGLLFLAGGVVDDLVGLSVRTKLVLQVLCATVAVSLGLSWDLTGVAAVDDSLSVFWIVLVVNALNLTDVSDGLVTGLAMVSLAAVAWIDPTGRALAVVVAGACLGFLPFNLPKASVFLGESGTASLGFVVAALTMNAAERAPAAVEVIALSLVVAVPLYELVFLVTVRTSKGMRWWHESADHVSLRLQAVGHSQWRVNCTMWFTAVGMALGGRLFLEGGPGNRVALGVAAGAVLVVASVLLITRTPDVPVERPGR